MDWRLVITQALNGIQLGLLLFLLASGLTLTFGIMDFVNLAHGSLYMIGAYFCATLTHLTGSFLLALGLTLPAVAVVGGLIELIVVRTLYTRHHLDHVLATFGLILCFDTLVQMLWGPEGMAIPLPAWPELMEGTYEGRIQVVDQSASDNGKFRFWVVPDTEGRGWPGPEQVRQGTQVMGWVILNRVPLWYELWRRFNLFPPDYESGDKSLRDVILPKAGRPGK